MLYDKFVEKVVDIDGSNIVKKREVDLESEPIPEIYAFYDLVRVEISCRMGEIKFFSFFELKEKQDEYSYAESDCVFATNNGEPIMIKNQEVYTCIVGKNKIIYEKLADSFDDFLRKILDT